MRIANEKASKNVTQRGNVPKTTVRMAAGGKQSGFTSYVHPPPGKINTLLIFSSIVSNFSIYHLAF
jgi:Ribosome associated membrane protein RAMP4